MVRTLAVVSSALVVTLILTGRSTPLRAQQAALDGLIASAVRYATAYQEGLAGIVSEEVYAQTWRRGQRVRETRALKSDVLLTRPTGGKRFLLFRDVFEVDGKQVRDRDERLQQLFLKPSASTSSQVLRILDESARYNVGDIARTVNTPTLVLAFLDPQFRERFVFDMSTDRVADSVRDLPASADRSQFVGGDDLQVLAYKEVWRESLIGSGAGLNLFSTGRFWVEPGTGRIVMTEVRFRNQRIDALISVRYDTVPQIDMLVPVAMRERYTDLRTESIVEGTATYTRVRRFNVTSSEAVKEPSQ